MIHEKTYAYISLKDLIYKSNADYYYLLYKFRFYRVNLLWVDTIVQLLGFETGKTTDSLNMGKAYCINK